MLQLHLSDQQFNCQLWCVLYYILYGYSASIAAVDIPNLSWNLVSHRSGNATSGRWCLKPLWQPHSNHTRIVYQSTRFGTSYTSVIVVWNVFQQTLKHSCIVYLIYQHQHRDSEMNKTWHWKPWVAKMSILFSLVAPAGCRYHNVWCHRWRQS